MSVKQKNHPPRWATRLLSWYCKPELLEDLEGDLNEYFGRNAKTKGARRARFIYIIDVLKFFRVYTIRKPKFINLLIHWIMIGSYVKTSGRSLMRNRLFSGINIIGLAVSMSVGLLMISFLADLFSYDDFHAKKDRIYRVITSDMRQGERTMKLATTSARAGVEIKEKASGVETVTMIRRDFHGDVQSGDMVVPLSGSWADDQFFNVFDYKLLQGDRATALKKPYSLVLTESSALKLFGTESALGKPVKLDTTEYTVTGVMQDLPTFTHLRFEALVSFATIELQNPNTSDGELFDWQNIYMMYVYALRASNASEADLQASIDAICAHENKTLEKGKSIRLLLQPLRKIVIGEALGNESGPYMKEIVLWILGGLVAVVIISSCFNYTNLSIARSLRRSREVGVRKVIGARKGQVVMQFIAESVIISLLALLMAFPLFMLLRSEFLTLAPILQDLATLELSVNLILYFIAFAILVGALAGFLPALFFSRVDAARALKDSSSLKLFRRVTLRKTLIVVQYVFSLIFLTTTVIGYNQYKNMLTFDLGFSTENILNIEMQGNKSERLKKELAALPQVEDISKSQMVLSLGSMWGTRVKHGADSVDIWFNAVDEHYLPLHEHRFIAGRNFNPRADSAKEDEIIVDMQVLKALNMANDPEKAVGETVIMGGEPITIVGVVEDFHYGTLLSDLHPSVFKHTNEVTSGHLNLKIRTADIPAFMATVDAIWKKFDKVHPLKARFYDEQLQEAYNQFIVMVKVIGFLAFLTVCIASMGLFGMVVFSTETRLKEISIRKVMGASDGKLIFLLGKGFLMLLIIAALIALPVTYLFFEKVVLVKIPFHKAIELNELVSGLFIIVLLAILMIGSQTLKAARSNPAQVLKNE